MPSAVGSFSFAAIHQAITNPACGGAAMSQADTLILAISFYLIFAQSVSYLVILITIWVIPFDYSQPPRSLNGTLLTEVSSRPLLSHHAQVQ